MASTGGGTLTPIADPTITTTASPDRSAPLLPLDEWRRVLGFNPWHFWGLSNDTHQPTSACNGVVRQYSWQSTDHAGRADIIESISTAERKFKSYIGFAPAPQFELDDVRWPQGSNRRSERLWSADAMGRRVGLHLKSGKLRALGVPRRTLIGNATVTLSDPDNDGLKERFTLTIGTTVTNPDEIAVYFIAADRLDGSDVAEKWRVQPVQVSITSGTATIVGRTWTIVKPIKYEGYTATELDPTVETNFAGTLAVYRYYADTTDQGLLVWESVPGCCCEGGIDPSSTTTATARYVMRDAELGWVAGEAASYNSTTALWEPAEWGVRYEPAVARVSYQAGVGLEAGQMNAQFKQIIARMAAAELSRGICACDSANHAIHQWQWDRARTGGANDESYSISELDLANPFGTVWGQIWAWKQVKHLALAGASLA